MLRTGSISNKVVTLDRLVKIRGQLRDAGLKLVQCHGCFDIVHPGHIRHLQFAASQGDRLVVSVTADAYVNKGPDQPMFTHDLRAENLAALAFVDWVYIHHEPTAVNLLGEVKPDIYIKGAEYASKNDQRFADERDVVESNHGRVVFSSGDVVFSSTSIVESIQKTSRADPDIAQLAQVAQQHDLSTSCIGRILDRAGGKRVVVVGETILDTYNHCQWPEIAEEHPMLSLRPVSSEQFDGGAAIVAQHLAALGMRPVLCTPISKQFDARSLMERMDALGVEVLPIEVEMRMPEKQRFLVGRDKVMKLDYTQQCALDSRQRAQVLDQVCSMSDLDGLVLTDFGLGLLSDGLAGALCDSLRDRVELIAGDVSGVRSSLLSMCHGDVLCPSEAELRQAMNDHHSATVELAHRLLDQTGSRAVIVTLGRDGLVVVTPDDQVVRLPALSHDPVDVLGCGDALLASVCASMLGDGGLVQSAYVGSIAAAIAGSVVGNVPVGAAQIIARGQSLGAQLAHAVAQHGHKSVGSPAGTPIV